MITITSNLESQAGRFDRWAVDVRRSMDGGLTETILFGHREVLKNLSGKAAAPAGSEPIPARTGHLKRSEGYISPGRSKHGLTAQPGQAMLVNTAAYAADIHEGAGRHAAFGRRPFMQSAADGMRQRLPDSMIVAIHRNLS